MELWDFVSHQKYQRLTMKSAARQHFNLPRATLLGKNSPNKVWKYEHMPELHDRLNRVDILNSRLKTLLSLCHQNLLFSPKVRLLRNESDDEWPLCYAQNAVVLCSEEGFLRIKDRH